MRCIGKSWVPNEMMKSSDHRCVQGQKCSCLGDHHPQKKCDARTPPCPVPSPFPLMCPDVPVFFCLLPTLSNVSTHFVPSLCTIFHPFPQQCPICSSILHSTMPNAVSHLPKHCLVRFCNSSNTAQPSRSNNTARYLVALCLPTLSSIFTHPAVLCSKPNDGSSDSTNA